MGAIGSGETGGEAWIRRRRRWLAGAGFALVAALVLLAAVSWHFSSAVLVPDRSTWPEDVTVERLTPDRIVLSRSEDAERPGVYGLDWQGGHAIVGEIVATQTRSPGGCARYAATWSRG